MQTIQNLVCQLTDLLEPNNFQDYCPNGLQVEGTPEFTKIVTGVSLNQALIEKAIENKAQVIIVHHGVFWHKSDYTITGLKYQRLAKLIKHQINLLAYHLPLDNQKELGNNVQLAKLLGFTVAGQTGSQNLLWYGKLQTQQLLSQLVNNYQQLTKHKPIYFGDESKLITQVAWCTGGADSMFHEAINLGVDCFITGEVSEPIMSMSNESGIAFIAGGHYVTERYGIMALTNHLQSLGYDAKFIELYNPI